MPKREINLTAEQELMILSALCEWYDAPMTESVELLYPNMKEDIEEIFKQFDAERLLKK